MGGLKRADSAGRGASNQIGSVYNKARKRPRNAQTEGDALSRGRPAPTHLGSKSVSQSVNPLTLPNALLEWSTWSSKSVRRQQSGSPIAGSVWDYGWC